LLRRLRRDARGVSIVEFGLVAIPLFIVLLGLFDLGYSSYAKSILEGTLYKATRRATTGNYTSTQIDSYISDTLAGFNSRATVNIVKRNYYEFSGVGQPEKITSDTYPYGSYNKGDCFEDDNGNGTYDTASTSGASGLGGSDAIVYYTVTMTFPRMFPLYGLLRWPSTVSVTDSTVLRNQPFGSQATPAIVCS
jgi:hypothetical protein